MAEDRPFFSEKAAWRSPITQGVSQWFPEPSGRRRWVAALAIGSALSKTEILNLLVQQVYLGRGCHGLRAAARAYFGKNAEALDVHEAALLAALVRQPIMVDSAHHQTRLRQRRDGVLIELARAQVILPQAARQAMARPSQFLRRRHRFWRRMAPGGTALRRPWLAAMRTMAEAGQIEIWAGPCAQDQVMLLALVDLAITLGKQPEQIRFRQFGTVRPWVGMTVDLPGQDPGLPPAMGCTTDLAKALRDTWHAICAPRPDRLFDLARDGLSVPGLPYLDRGLHAFTECYPDPQTGLDRADTRLLHQAAGRRWQPAARWVAPVMTGDDGGPMSGDMVLFERLRRMANPAQAAPLLECRELDKRFHTREMRLTEAGRAFLAGERHAVAENGLDRWVGGVHLNSRAGRIWYRDGSGQLVQG